MEEINDSLIKLLNDFNERYTSLKRSLPYHLNVIDELHINENAHSRILCKLLQYQSEIGKYEFLESLIRFIVNKDKHNGSFSKIVIKNPEITQEKERIDLWVKDKDYAIIIENKVCDANDQEAQIARYILKTRACRYSDDKIYVIYMPSTGEKEASEQTWIDVSNPQKPQDLKGAFQDRYVKLSFREDILIWLKECVLPNIRYKDKYLHSAISQYIDFLDGIYSLRTIEKQMNMELDKFFTSQLNLQGKDEKECINILQNKLNDFYELTSMLEKKKGEYRQQIINNWKTKTAVNFPELLPNEKGDYTDVTFMVDNKKANVLISEDSKGLYCQVQFDRIYEEKDRLIAETWIETLEDILPKSGKDCIWEYFPHHNYDEVYGLFVDVVNRCKALLKK